MCLSVADYIEIKTERKKQVHALMALGLEGT